VTGLYPAHHGIVNNVFFDPALGEYFHFNRAVSSTDSRWWGGEPIWVTAEKQGVRSASYFWVGSEAAIEGIRPTYWKHFDYTIPFYRRLDELTGWLTGPPAKRPRLITFYFSEVDSTAHKFGPDAPETVDAMRLLDRETGRVIERVALEGRRPNVIVVSDHGMTALSPQRVLFLDDYVNMKDVQDDFDGPGVGLRPLRGTPQELVARFAKAPHAHAMLAGDLPARFHLTGNARIPPVWILLDSGWFMETHAKYNARWGGLIKADHGYDPQDADMHGILIANGPSFHSDGRVIPEVENIHIYNLMCALLGIQPAPNDGDDRLVRSMLAAP
jgi:predicted AlkP superfamily pyrophosphatase or phosphodiesterase